jgi:hypothetical protein
MNCSFAYLGNYFNFLYTDYFIILNYVVFWIYLNLLSNLHCDCLLVFSGITWKKELNHIYISQVTVYSHTYTLSSSGWHKANDLAQPPTITFYNLCHSPMLVQSCKLSSHSLYPGVIWLTKCPSSISSAFHCRFQHTCLWHLQSV